MMSYYHEILLLMSRIHDDIFNYDHREIPNRPAVTMEEIEDKIELLQMKVNQQVAEWHNWIMQRKNLI